MEDSINLALALLRVCLGLTLAAHGYGKFFRGGRIPGTARWFDSMGMRPGKVHALMAASTEVSAGLGIAVGLLTPFACMGLVGVMVVAGWTVHRKNGFFIVKEGWEYNFILAAMAIVLGALGPGEWSLDHALDIADDLDGYTGLIIAALGLVAGALQLAIFYRPPAPKPSET
jgi:putative oxidoreductase